MSTGEWRKRYYTRIGRKLQSYRNELVHSRHGQAQTLVVIFLYLCCMLTANKAIVADLLFSQVDSCRYWLTGRLTVNRRVISFFHSPVLLYAVLAFHSVNRCDL